MGKVKIAKHDYLRVILTEALPYEVPINFLNEGLYFYLKSLDGKERPGAEIVSFLGIFFSYEKYTKPYNYRIHKNSSSKRLLSVPHPAVQFLIAELYRDYDSVMTELCSKSPISLRSPARVASRFYEKEFVNYSEKDSKGGVEVEEGAYGKVSPFASSYFTYKKYNFLYKYYDSYEAHRIEKKFEHLSRFDISKCFHNIYVPSFGWAVKGKDFAKRYSDHYSIESRFQGLMQKANENEDSGIIIGPEFSRIYAEVILQRIDLDIIHRVKNDLSLYYDKDYTVRRYVDDYFLYTKSQSDALKILDLVTSELEKYKLFVNESKTEFVSVPFITGLTIAKMDSKELVRETFNRFFNDAKAESEGAYFLRRINAAKEANRFIKSFKRLVMVNDVSYESLSGYTLGEVRRKLFRIIEDERVVSSIMENDSLHVQQIILFCLEAAFFIYSMDIRVRTTYIITQIVVRLNSITESGHVYFRDAVRKKIYDESVLLLSKMKDKGKKNSIEALNLLVSIKTNFDDYPISEDDILKLFDLEVEGSKVCKSHTANLGYFQTMVLSSFVETQYLEINDFIMRDIFLRFEGLDGEEIRASAEMTCLFFDSLSNPSFNHDFKKRLFAMVCDKINAPSSSSVIFDFIVNREWFFTWKKDNLAQVLMKKELRSPY